MFMIIVKDHGDNDKLCHRYVLLSLGSNCVFLDMQDLAEAQLEPDVFTLRRIKRSVLGRCMVEKNDLPASASPRKSTSRAISGRNFQLNSKLISP